MGAASVADSWGTGLAARPGRRSLASRLPERPLSAASLAGALDLGSRPGFLPVYVVWQVTFAVRS